MNEFELINTYIKPLTNLITDSTICKSIGDDAAVLQIPSNKKLVVSQDTYNLHTHFIAEQPIGHVMTHCLLAAISDLVAMGAIAKYLTLSISLDKSKIDKEFIIQLTSAIEQVCKQYQISLIGGDTTNGPLSITANVMGFIPEDSSGLLRSNAKINDLICVTGFPGSANLGLQWLFSKANVSKINPAWTITLPDSELEDINYIPTNSNWNFLYSQLTNPKLNFKFSQELLIKNLSTCGIDVSDGIIGDLYHIALQSKLTASLDTNLFKLPQETQLLIDQNMITKDQAINAFLYGGDDYQLLFTIKPNDLKEVEELAKQCSTTIQVIGKFNTYNNQSHINLDSQNLTFKSYQAFN